jgi:serine/threonine-protein kinase
MRFDIERAMAGMPIATRSSAVPVAADLSATTVIPISNPATATTVITKPKPGSRRKWVTVTIASVTSALLLLFVGSQLLGPSQELVATPNLKSKTIDEATLALSEVGLKVGTQTPQADDNVPKGTVIGQDPAPGELIEAGQAVNLIVSAGPIDSDKPEGTILEQDPAANTVVDIGTLISVTVSNGKIPVPDVVGKNETQAKNTLVNAGFLVDIVRQADGSVAVGTVLSQSPESTELALKGSIVTLTVASAPVAIVCPDGSSVPWDGVCPSPTPTVTTP